MKQNKSFLILFFFSAVFAACNSNNNSSSGETDTTTVTTTDGTMADTTATSSGVPLSDDDKEFIMEAAKGGMMEVEAGKMAQEKGLSQRVKDFGAMMVRDHSQANQELKSIASSKNVMLPDSLDADMREHMDAMRKMSGKEFDKHYISMMKDDHKEDVNKFEKASNDLKDADLKAFATKTLPVLRTHRDSVDAISKAMK